MLKVYKKIEKRMDNLLGILEVDNFSSLDKPFLLCLSTQDEIDKSIFGIMKMGVRAARVNTIDEVGAAYKIDEFPVDFLGMKYAKDESNKGKPKEIAEHLLYPFLIAKGKDVYHMKKQARRINLFTFCAGTISYKEAEKELEEKLKDDNFYDEDINEILSQISLVAIGTMVDTSTMKAHTTTFIDVNDEEIFTGISKYYQKLLQEKRMKSLHGILGSEKHVLYVYNGSGFHSLKENFLDDNIVKPAISSVVASYLQNSVQNEKVTDLIRVDGRDILKQLDEYGVLSKDPLSLLKDLDNILSYDTPKYTLEEAKMRQELDRSYKEMMRVKNKLDLVDNEKKRKENKINSLVEYIHEYSSEVTYYQILVNAGLWQQGVGVDVFGEASDKEIRKLYEEIVRKK